ncbi:MAG: hypothetical protein HY898_17260 [Deltaproteobacteria bacterium]|nr:hypothetical protein [Deltaproteobacteria bacterium]
MRRTTICLLVLTSAVWTTPSAAFTLDDSLKGSTQGQVFGGSVGADGFTTTAATDAIVWVVPSLASGSVEFTVTGITLDKIPAIDHEIFSMYDGFGFTEPISYNPKFRNNNFKMLVRIYGQGEPTRTGMQKLLYSMCPMGPPGYSDGAPCPCASYFNEEPFGGDTNWSGAPEVLRVEWTPTSASYFRNGAKIHSMDWSSTGILWGPKEQHVMLGSPRNQLGPDVAMPVGVTFSDVHINGTEGTPTGSCIGGTGGSAGSAGAAGSGGGPGCSPDLSAVSLTPSNGSGVSSTFTAVYRYAGGADKLSVAQLYVGDQVAAGVPSVNLSIDATAITLDNQSCAPGEARVLQGTYGSVDCSKTGYSVAGTDATITWGVSFLPTAFAGKHGVFMDAKAQGDPAPRLCWTKMGDWEVPGGGSGGAAGDGGSKGGSDGSDASPGGASGAGGTSYAGWDKTEGDDGGCGCRAAGSQSGSARPLYAVALALGLLRRRVRRRGDATARSVLPR